MIRNHDVAKLEMKQVKNVDDQDDYHITMHVQPRIVRFKIQIKQAMRSNWSISNSIANIEILFF